MTARNIFIPKNAYCDFADYSVVMGGVCSFCFPGR